MLLIATVVQSCVYAVPAAVVGLLEESALVRAKRLIKRACKTPTSCCAETVLSEFLHAHGVDDVVVTKGTDYLSNSYERDEKRALLRPDSYGCVDACSIADALVVGAKILCYHDAPDMPEAIERLHTRAAWVFWIAFCLLAFAIMGASLPGAILGYAALALFELLLFARARLVKQSMTPAKEFVADSGLFTPEEAKAVLSAIDALRVSP